MYFPRDRGTGNSRRGIEKKSAAAQAVSDHSGGRYHSIPQPGPTKRLENVLKKKRRGEGRNREKNTDEREYGCKRCRGERITPPEIRGFLNRTNRRKEQDVIAILEEGEALSKSVAASKKSRGTLTGENRSMQAVASLGRAAFESLKRGLLQKKLEKGCKGDGGCYLYTIEEKVKKRRTGRC